MLMSAVLNLSLRSKDLPLGVSGQEVHGWFLDVIKRHDESLSAELHRPGRHKPFTLSFLQPQERQGTVETIFHGGPPGGKEGPGDRVWWLRITSLVRPLSELLVGLRPEKIGVVRLGRGEFTVTHVTTKATEHPWASTCDFGGMRKQWMDGNPPPGRVRLRFVSPTAFEFSKSSGNMLFPLPDLVFESLGRKWNQHAPHEISEVILKECYSTIRVEAHHLRTEVVKFRGSDGKEFIEKGFVGWCEFSMGRNGSPDARRALHLLANFALYAGVGAKTTMGMGQATLMVPRGKAVKRANCETSSHAIDGGVA